MTLDEAAAHLRKNLLAEEARMVEDLERQGWSQSEIDRMVRFMRDENEPILDGLRGGKLN